MRKQIIATYFCENKNYRITYNILSKIIQGIYAFNQLPSSIENIVDILTDHHEHVEIIKKEPFNL